MHFTRHQLKNIRLGDFHLLKETRFLLFGQTSENSIRLQILEKGIGWLDLNAVASDLEKLAEADAIQQKRGIWQTNYKESYCCIATKYILKNIEKQALSQSVIFNPIVGEISTKKYLINPDLLHRLEARRSLKVASSKNKSKINDIILARLPEGDNPLCDPIKVSLSKYAATIKHDSTNDVNFNSLLDPPSDAIKITSAACIDMNRNNVVNLMYDWAQKRNPIVWAVYGVWATSVTGSLGYLIKLICFINFFLRRRRKNLSRNNLSYPLTYYYTYKPN